ncbi:MAG TPA: DUF1848 domain-containing protein [Sedimentisphaerales bacterium]|nr:DUF1848 domain-containing protein [Sedimentisphaerales bacterium]
MKRIISVSRRTDVPAFYGDWFMGRITEGFAGVVNPFGGKRYVVSLRPQDVVCFVFWSKDFTPFFENLKILDRLGYKFYFNYTVTGLPAIFESNVHKRDAIETLRQLSKIYSPKDINWRFDPIIISTVTDCDFWLRAFREIAAELEGYVERCYFSFVVNYGKVIRNFTEFEKAHNLKIYDPDNNFKIELANELADIAAGHGIRMCSCCGDYLVGDKIKKAHCIDGRTIDQLFSPDGFTYCDKPTRKECGCTESSDIGAYDTCPHGCVYCYATMNKPKARAAFKNHDPTAAFLGYIKTQSDKWLAELEKEEIQKDSEQLQMF